ncbi:MAG: hypothetical protein ACRDVL_03060 [Acidimicrobiia bacterium]
MTDLPAPEQALGSEELQRFVEACSREKRSPITHKTIDAISYGWLQRFVSEHLDPPDRVTAPWPPPPEVDRVALSGFFSRVMLRTREGPARDYADRLAAYFDQTTEGLAGWGRKSVVEPGV